MSPVKNTILNKNIYRVCPIYDIIKLTPGLTSTTVLAPSLIFLPSYFINKFSPFWPFLPPVLNFILIRTIFL